MGTQGKKNTPITARVNAGLFNQKKGITEPLLGVGPAGVYGNNQTKDIPSPSKMRGYAKRSPLKQEKLKDPVVTKATKTDIEVIDPVKTKGKETTVYTPPTTTPEGDKAYAAKTQAEKDAQDAKYIKNNTKKTKGKDTQTCPDGSTLVNGKCQKTKKTETKKTSLTKDAEDTQTARERSNTVRGGSRMNRKEKNAAVKEAKAQAKIDNPDDRKARRKAVKTAKNKAKLTQAQKDRKLAAASGAGAQRQAEQNRSISARKTGTVKSEARVVESFDQSKSNVTENANEFANGGPDTTSTTAKPNPASSGVTNEELAGTDKVKSPSPKKKGFGMKKPLYK